ncbi:MAG: DUF3365 domain-containing protein [Verrucomicrobia bacterium]|nr:MAG: DUF3365 domain-containing protein [Verrucomicrobiota bacterium]
MNGRFHRIRGRGILWLTLLTLGLAAAGCRRSGPETTPPSPPRDLTDFPPVESVPGAALERLRPVALERGRRIAAEAFTVLSGELRRALEAGGFTNAIRLCSVKALPLTRLVGDTNQVRLRRVSHRARNPANQADTEELRIIECYQEMLAEGVTNLAPVVVQPATNRITFYAPIVLNNPLCLACHGEPGSTLLPQAAELLPQLYPEDRATGFRLGDLRGLWRIDFTPESLTNASPAGAEFPAAAASPGN